MMHSSVLPKSVQPLPFDLYEIILPHINLVFHLLKTLKYYAEFSLINFPHLNTFEF